MLTLTAGLAVRLVQGKCAVYLYFSVWVPGVSSPLTAAGSQCDLSIATSVATPRGALLCVCSGSDDLTDAPIISSVLVYIMVKVPRLESTIIIAALLLLLVMELVKLH